MRMGLAFIVLGSVFLAVGIWAIGIALPAGLWAVLIWPGACFLLVGAAYLRLGAGLLGKRADGSLPWWLVGLLLPYFLLTWAIWRLLRLSKERCFDEVAPGLYLGRRPLKRELPEDVRVVVDLTAEFPRIEHGDNREYWCLPTLDGHVPDPETLRALVQRVADHPGPLYVHCAQGHGRSAVVAGAVLVARGLASSAADAERIMKELRPGVHLSPSQRHALEQVTRGMGEP